MKYNIIFCWIWLLRFIFDSKLDVRYLNDQVNLKWCVTSIRLPLPFLSTLRIPLRKKIMAPLGPRRDLCVVVVTTSLTFRIGIVRDEKRLEVRHAS